MARQIGEGISLLPRKTPQRWRITSLPSIMHWAPCSRRSQTEMSTLWERAHSWWFCHPHLGDACKASGDPHGSQYHETTWLGQQCVGPCYWAGYVATHLLSDWKSNPVICPPQVGEGGRSQILQVLPASTHSVWMQPNQWVESYLNQADSGYSDHCSFTWLHLSECLDLPTSSLVISWSCSSHQYLFQGFGFDSSSSYERSQLTTSPWSRIPFSGSLSDGPWPQNGGPNQAGAPSVLSKGAENSLSTASASPSSCHPFLWGWERSHPHNDKEITGAGALDHYHRPWSRALHQESGSPFPDQRGSRTEPSGSGHWKEPVSSPKGIWEETEPVDSLRGSIPLSPWSPLCSPGSAGLLSP